MTVRNARRPKTQVRDSARTGRRVGIARSLFQCARCGEQAEPKVGAILQPVGWIWLQTKDHRAIVWCPACTADAPRWKADALEVDVVPLALTGSKKPVAA